MCWFVHSAARSCGMHRLLQTFGLRTTMIGTRCSRAALISLLSFSNDIGGCVFGHAYARPGTRLKNPARNRPKSGRQAAPLLALLCLGKVGRTALAGFSSGVVSHVARG